MLAPAKINLYLNITGKLENGYHLLDSLVVFVDIFDVITITLADKFSLEISGDFAYLVENNERNIISRAAQIMAAMRGRNANFAIKLAKNIPVGAGLGGGSSDCAATIILLNDLLGLNFSKEELSEIGEKLGADVPIFINRHAAFVTGIGEQICNIENLPEFYALLVYPNKPLSTKDVFTEFSQLGKYTSQEAITSPINEAAWLEFLQNRTNDLANPAIKLLPEIQEIISELSKLDGCIFARMSGSGSTCFAIFTDKTLAEAASTQMQKKYPHYWVKAAQVLESATEIYL